MKKIAASMLVTFALVLSSVPGLSIGNTSRVNAFEFCELYVQRCKDMGIDLHVVPNSFLPIKWGANEYYVTCSAGSLLIDITDFSIIEAHMTFMDLKSDDNDEYVLQSLAALSALEFDSSSDGLLQIVENMTASEKALEIFSEEISPYLDEDAFTQLYAEKEMLFYSGNYEYTLVYHKDDTEGPKGEPVSIEYIYLIAEKA